MVRDVCQNRYVCVCVLLAKFIHTASFLLIRHPIANNAGHNVDAAVTALVEQIMQKQGVTAGGDDYKVIKLGEGGAADSGGGCC